jgi:hypothetical protein
LAALARAGDASAEPRLFDATIVFEGATFTFSNPGRFADLHGSDLSFDIDASLLGGWITTPRMAGAYPATIFFSLMNEAGSFTAGGGPGTGMLTPLPSAPGFRASFSGGPSQFGGTQRLLGQFLWKLAPPLDHIKAYYQPFSVLGGSFGGTDMGITGGTAGFTRWTAWGFPWTTGAVTAMGTGFMGTPITLSAEGSDLRTPSGAGTLSLVTPHLVWRDRVLSLPTTGTPFVATLRLQFAPEPGATVLLLSGIAGLAALSRFARRR